MSQYDNQNQIPVAYPPPVSTPTYVAPPPPGYPTRDGQGPAPNAVPIETRTRGDGFWKGCCAVVASWMPASRNPRKREDITAYFS